MTPDTILQNGAISQADSESNSKDDALARFNLLKPIELEKEVSHDVHEPSALLRLRFHKSNPRRDRATASTNARALRTN